MSGLLAFDHQLFLAVNGLQGSPAFDALCLWGTELGTIFGGVLICIVYLLHAPRPIRWRALSLSIVLMLLVGLFSTLLKYAVHRERPPLVLAQTLVLGPRLTLFSFPSGHSVTAFSLLAFLLVVDRPLALVWLPLACFVGFSRIYLGVHFPSDVLFGAAFGFLGVYPVAKRVWGR